MQVLNAIDPTTATGRAKELFGAVEQRLKQVPNMLRLMANSPAILGAYLQFNEAFEHTRLTPRLRGLITVAVAELNGCDYTLSTAMALGRREGLKEHEFTRARRAEASDPETAAALRFAATGRRPGTRGRRSAPSPRRMWPACSRTRPRPPGGAASCAWTSTRTWPGRRRMSSRD